MPPGLLAQCTSFAWPLHGTSCVQVEPTSEGEDDEQPGWKSQQKDTTGKTGFPMTR